MATTIKIKSSSVGGKTPTSLQPAELAINLVDKKLFSSDAGGTVFELGVSDVDLGYIAAPDKGTVTNSAGDDAEIPLADGTDAGLSLNNFSATDVTTLGSALQPGDDVSDLNNDAAYITLADIPPVVGFVALDDGGTEQSITGGGGLDVVGGVTSEFGVVGAQLGNVAPLNDWSCYPARAMPFVAPVLPAAEVEEPEPVASGSVVTGIASGGIVSGEDTIDLGLE